jgi:hypothetical protein
MYLENKRKHTELFAHAGVLWHVDSGHAHQGRFPQDDLQALTGDTLSYLSEVTLKSFVRDAVSTAQWTL